MEGTRQNVPVTSEERKPKILGSIKLGVTTVY